PYPRNIRRFCPLSATASAPLGRMFSYTTEARPAGMPLLCQILDSCPTIELLQHGVAHSGGGDLGGAGRGDVACADAGREYALRGLIDEVRIVTEAEGIAQHHGDAEQGGERIGEVLAGDVRGRAMYRLVEGAAAAGGIGGRGGGPGAPRPAAP